MVQEPKDPAIKLFGMEIPLSSNGGCDDVSACSDTSSVGKEYRDEEQEEEAEREKLRNSEEYMHRDGVCRRRGIDVSLEAEDIETASVDDGEAAKSMSSKTMKKPDKILPCPRCNSANTKFCYYNNYNVNQPRHFCRSCQRYWTAGGNMRTMPVGAGRRKTKRTSSHYRHISISEVLQAVQIDAASNGIHRPILKHGDGIILKFGDVDPPILDSTASILNDSDKKGRNGLMNALRSPKSGKQSFSNAKGENRDDRSSESTVSALSSNTGGGTANSNFHPQIPGVPGIPWPYPWSYPAILPPPTLCPPGYSMPFYPSAFLNCSFLNNWNLPPLVPSHSVPDSPTLGKHARDGEFPDSENPSKRSNGSVLVPKTLRMDDPDVAARSTIWSTLGIKKDSFCGEGFLKSQPARNALPRSLNLVETSST